MLLIRSLCFQLYFFVTVAIGAAAVILCWPFGYRARFRLARAWALVMLIGGRRICGLKYSVEGLGNLPQEPSVIMIKHSTVFETYAQLVFFPLQTWVLKRELKWLPLFGWGLALLRPIAINRGAGHSAVRQVIDQGKVRLAEGIWVTVFPEGTRVAPGKTKKYGVSGAALAREAGVKIVPVAQNAGDLWPRRGFIKKPGLIRFVIGPPVDASAQSPKETNLLVQGWIELKMREISSGYAEKS